MTIQRNPLNLAKDAIRYRPRSKKSKPQGFPASARRLIAARSGGICEIADCPEAAVHMHHRRPRGLGGTSVPWVNRAANGLHICLEHHAFIESHRTLALVQGWLISQHMVEKQAADVPVLRRGRSVLLSDDGGVRPVGGDL
ncbi:hypothetical protein ACQP1O_42905 (plasmid) [Nocardia sp. CA-151230]|uniref:hypothetical protein n=1 Tax=Nocardia sp. CA-151230 TaxID=3239982 RepID=UPI003D8C9DAA